LNEQSALPHSIAPKGLWAITSFFNPLSFHRRRANYSLFRQHLHLPLVAVELAFGPDFELDEGDAEILVQIRGGDILWQKERLLNLALARLPADCSAVAWIDCDVIFERDDWADVATRLLDRFPMLQPFAEKHNLPRDWVTGNMTRPAARVLHPPAWFLAEGMSPEACFGNSPADINCAPGLAWVARREFLNSLGFYDACIIGGGDHAFAAAVYGCSDEAAASQAMNEQRREHYLGWARPAHEAARGRVGFIEGRLFHLWHGSVANRAYRRRHQEFACFQLDPFEDLALATSGAWQWNSAKPEMHAFVKDYLASRREDG
jgi:hypothetical protein